MLAFIKQETSKVTMDDLRKEMVLSSLPQDIQRSMADRVTSMTAEQAAALADKYFDKDGKVLHPSSGSAINAIETKEQRGEETEDEPDVNAIRGRRQPFKKQQQKKPFQRSSFTPAFSSAPSANASASAAASSTPSSAGNKGGVTSKPTCRHHLRYGEKSFSCEVGCQFYPGKAKQGNGQAGGRL